jgi:hypothetical protein
MKKPTPEIIARLNKEENIWLASVRPNSKPHLVPVWFIWNDETLFICISSESVKFKNISQNAQVSISLEDGNTPVICEGLSERITRPWSANIVKQFKIKYDWNIETDQEYNQLISISPQKWLYWK